MRAVSPSLRSGSDGHCGRRGDRRRLGRAAARRRLRRPTRRPSSPGSPGWRSRCAPSWPPATGSSATSARWEDLLEDDGARRRQRRGADVPARADHDRGARARAARAVREADRADASRRPTRWSRPRARPAACSTSRFNHRQRGDIQTLARGRRGGPARAAVLRQGVVAAADRHPARWGAGSRRAELAGGGPLLDIGVHVLDYALFLLGQPAVDDGQRLDLRPARHGRVRLEPGRPARPATAGGANFDVEDLATVFLRLDGRRHAAARGELGRAPDGRRRVRASRSTAPRAARS